MLCFDQVGAPLIANGASTTSIAVSVLPCGFSCEDDTPDDFEIVEGKTLKLTCQHGSLGDSTTQSSPIEYSTETSSWRAEFTYTSSTSQNTTDTLTASLGASQAQIVINLLPSPPIVAIPALEHVPTESGGTLNFSATLQAAEGSVSAGLPCEWTIVSPTADGAWLNPLLMTSDTGDISNTYTYLGDTLEQITFQLTVEEEVFGPWTFPL